MLASLFIAIYNDPAYYNGVSRRSGAVLELKLEDGKIINVTGFSEIQVPKGSKCTLAIKAPFDEENYVLRLKIKGGDEIVVHSGDEIYFDSETLYLVNLLEKNNALILQCFVEAV